MAQRKQRRKVTNRKKPSISKMEASKRSKQGWKTRKSGGAKKTKYKTSYVRTSKNTWQRQTQKKGIFADDKVRTTKVRATAKQREAIDKDLIKGGAGLIGAIGAYSTGLATRTPGTGLAVGLPAHVYGHVKVRQGTKKLDQLPAVNNAKRGRRTSNPSGPKTQARVKKKKY